MCVYGDAYIQGFTDGINTQYSLHTIEILERMPGNPYVLGLLAGSRAATTNPIGPLRVVPWNMHYRNGIKCMKCLVPWVVSIVPTTVPSGPTTVPSGPHTIPW